MSKSVKLVTREYVSYCLIFWLEEKNLVTRCIFNISRKWKLLLDKRGFRGAIMMELSKTFDTINHSLTNPQFSLYPDTSIINGREKRSIHHVVSDWTKLDLGVPQGSVLGFLLFHMCISDLTYIIHDTDICNYPYNNAIHSTDSHYHFLYK